MLRALLIYTTARIAIFAVLLALLWAVKLGSYPGILFALLLSMPAAYFLLGKQRADLAQAINERREVREAFRARLRGNEEAEEDEPGRSDREPDREQDTKQ